MQGSRIIANELSRICEVELRVGEDYDIIELGRHRREARKVILEVSQGSVTFSARRWPNGMYEHLRLARHFTLADPDCIGKIMQTVSLYFACCRVIGERKLTRLEQDFQ
jgi:hypothetical protein